jgi:hypothetical protein
MEFENITSILQSLTKNLVNIPIKTNNYEETNKEHLYYDVKQQCHYDSLDDILGEFRNMKQNNTSKTSNSIGKIIYTDKSNKQDVDVDLHLNILSSTKKETNNIQYTYIESLLFVLCCIKEPTLSLQKDKDRKSNIVKMRVDLLQYLSQSKVKDLELSKYKYTKKSIKEILDKCLIEKNEYTYDIVRTILVLAIRMLKVNCILMIDRDIKEIFNIPKTIHVDNPISVTIIYSNGTFSLDTLELNNS